MCRIYGFRSTHPTEVECALLDAQNALIRQSEGDARGLVNDDGWGMGVVKADETVCKREVGPAAESEDYRRSASRIAGTTIVAHVRRATVGRPTVENTHPFRAGGSMLVHNGHLGDFDRLRDRFLNEMGAEHADAVAGTTDSEHLFHLLLSRLEVDPGSEPRSILSGTLRDVLAWNESMAAGREEVAANVLWVVDGELYGSRLGRSLFHLDRDGQHRCPSCGKQHPARVPEGEAYRAVAVASERLTDEAWRPVPEGSVFRVDERYRLDIRPLEG